MLEGLKIKIKDLEIKKIERKISSIERKISKLQKNNETPIERITTQNYGLSYNLGKIKDKVLIGLGIAAISSSLYVLLRMAKPTPIGIREAEKRTRKELISPIQGSYNILGELEKEKEFLKEKLKESEGKRKNLETYIKELENKYKISLSEKEKKIKSIEKENEAYTLRIKTLEKEIKEKSLEEKLAQERQKKIYILIKEKQELKDDYLSLKKQYDKLNEVVKKQEVEIKNFREIAKELKQEKDYLNKLFAIYVTGVHGILENNRPERVKYILGRIDTLKERIDNPEELLGVSYFDIKSGRNYYLVSIAEKELKKAEKTYFNLDKTFKHYTISEALRWLEATFNIRIGKYDYYGRFIPNPEKERKIVIPKIK